MARGTIRRDQLAVVFGDDQDLIRRVAEVVSDNVEYDSITINVTIYAGDIKSGANQAAAGAVAGELWVDTGDQTVKRGV